jgi:hypothetical protein
MMLRIANVTLLATLAGAALCAAPEAVQAVARQLAWIALGWTLASALSLGVVVAAFRAAAQANEALHRGLRREEWLAASIRRPGTARR